MEGPRAGSRTAGGEGASAAGAPAARPRPGGRGSWRGASAPEPAPRTDLRDAAAAAAAQGPGRRGARDPRRGGGVRRPRPRPDPALQGESTGRVGPHLAQLRAQQGEHREYYTLDHLERLQEFEASVPWRRENHSSKAELKCTRLHKQPCKSCTTCHFCRQKTVDQKTWCPCALKKGRIIGGKGRGILCGTCLEMRFGENLDEALADPSWRCPACRDICNCSGVNCLRARRGLFPTNQLANEAAQMGYKSVAHYLILTHLTGGQAMPMLEIVGRRPRRPEPVEQLAEGQDQGGGGLPARAPLRTEEEHARFEERVSRQAVLLKQDFPLPDGLSAARLFDDPAGALFDDPAGPLPEMTVGPADPTEPDAVLGTVPGAVTLEVGGSGRLFGEFDKVGNCTSAGARAQVQAPILLEEPPGRVEGPTAAVATADRAHSLPPPGHTPRAQLGDAEAGGGTDPVGSAYDRSALPSLAMETAAPPVLPRHPVRGVGGTTPLNVAARQQPPEAGPAINHSVEEVPESESEEDDMRHRRLSRGLRVAAAVTDNTASSRFVAAVQEGGGGASGLGASEVRALPVLSSAALHDGDSESDWSDGLQDRRLPGMNVQRPLPQEPQERAVLGFRSDNGPAAEKAAAPKRKRASLGPKEHGPARRRSGRWILSSPEASEEENCPPKRKENVEVSKAACLPFSGQIEGGELRGSLVAEHEGRVRQSSALEDGGTVMEGTEEVVGAAAEGGPDLAPGQGVAGGTADAQVPPGRSSWGELLYSVQSLTWEGLSNGQKNQAASSVLQKFPQQAVQVIGSMPDFVAEGSSSQESFLIASLNDLKHAFEILLSLAAHIPERQLGPLISKRLFSANPVLQFSRSDMRPRAIMLNAGFSFLKVLKRRNLSAKRYIPLILESVTALGAEFEELHAIKPEEKFAVAMVVGCTNIPVARTTADSEENRAAIREAMRGNELLLEIMLAHIEVAVKSGLEENFEFLSPALSDFLGARRPFPGSVRKRVLGIISSSITACRSTEPGIAMQTAKALLEEFWSPLDGIISLEYPLRRGLSSIQLESPASLEEEEDLSGKAMQALASIAALRLHLKLWSWDDVEKEALKPSGPALFWSSSFTRERHFGFKFLSAVVFNLKQYDYVLSGGENVSLLKVWLLAMLDPSQTTVQVVATVSMRQLPCLDTYLEAVPRNPMQTLHALKADRDGSQRSEWVAQCFQQAVSRNRMSQVNGWPVLVRECFLRWLKEVEQISYEQCQDWRSVFCRVVAACLSAQDKGNTQLCQPARGDSGTMLSILLKLLVSEVANSASTIQKTSLTFHETASDGLLEEIGGARERVKRSPLGCLPVILGSIAEFKTHDPGALHFLHSICTSVIEPLPGFPTRVSAAETAVFEVFAAAMAPSPAGAPTFKPASSAFQVCHYFLGTYCRRWLVRSSFRPSSCEKEAVNCLRAVNFIFSQASCRSSAPFQPLLALLFGPFLDCMSPENGEKPSDSSLVPLFDLWAALVRSRPDLVTSPDDAGLTASLRSAYNGNLLLAGGALPEDAFCAGAWISLHSMCRTSLSSICAALRGRILTPGERGDLWKSLQKSGGSNELESFKSAKSSLFRTFGRPLPVQAVEALYSRPAFRGSTWSAQTDDFGWNSEEAVRNGAAKSAMKFLISLAKSGQNGQRWAAQLVPAVCFQMNDAKAIPPALERLYDELRSQCADAILSEYSLKPKTGPADGAAKVALVTDFSLLGEAVGREIAVQGTITARDPARGTKPLKTQKNVVTLSLQDSRGGEVRMLCAGASAVRVARTLDNAGQDCGLVRFEPVRVFVRRDNGSVMLQGLNKTSVAPHISA